jgi:hypothetical protein
MRSFPRPSVAPFTKAIARAAALFALAGQSVAAADEGMWLFTAPPTEAIREKYGFTITPAWLEHLQRSCVRFSTGGSGSFVSADGLVMTNHHVASDMLAKLSTREQNLLEKGFYAKTRAEEAPCPDLELVCLWEIADMTARVEGAATKEMSVAEAASAKRKRTSEIEKEETEKSGMKCEMVTLYQGGRYHLYRYKRYTDVRLVFAPDKKAAFFGGDPDNFEFPRFDLDCAFFRVYQDGQAQKPEHFLRWSPEGCSEGELVFVAGHPGRTERLFTVDHLRYLRDARMPMSLARLWRTEEYLEWFSGRSKDWQDMVEDDLFSVQNSRKANMGIYAGLLDPALWGAKIEAEKKLRAAVDANPEWKAKWGDAWNQIALALDVQRAIMKRTQAANAIGSELFGIGRTLLRLGDELPKPSAERLREYNDAALESLRFQLFSPAPIHLELEILRVESSLAYMAELLGGEDPLVLAALDGKSPAQRAEECVLGTKLGDVEFRRALHDGGKAAIDAAKDPMLDLARALDGESRSLRKRFEDEIDGPIKAAYAKIASANFALEGDRVYPDATFTLRLSYGTVKGYEEAGAHVAPFTTLEGVYQRSAERGGLPPFQLDPRWIERRARLDGSTPFDFVSTCDIIGGNSGSPTVNQEGEVVGLIFDGNLQSLSWDVAFTEEQGRAVSVDSRALIEAMTKVYDAQNLAKELTATTGS